MKSTRTIEFALLLTSPTTLLAHPGHAPGEPEHWVMAAMFAALSLAALALWQHRQAARTRGRRRGEHE